MEERERRKPNPTEYDDREVASTSNPQNPPTPHPARRDEPHHGDTEEDDDSVKLDICSDTFDPLLALYSPTVPLPFPNIKCFNNVSEYESFLKGGRGRAKPENVEKKLRKAMEGVVDPQRIQRLKDLMVPKPGESSAPPRRRRQKTHKNVVSRMQRRFCYTYPVVF